MQAQQKTNVGEYAQPVAGCDGAPQPGHVVTVKPLESTRAKAGMGDGTRWGGPG